MWIHHYTLHSRGCVVSLHAGFDAVVVFGNHDGAAVWIEQELIWIKAQTTLWFDRSVNPIAVDLARRHVGHEDVPIVVGAVGGGIDRNDPRGASIIFPIKEQQLDPGSVPGVDAEVHS